MDKDKNNRGNQATRSKFIGLERRLRLGLVSAFFIPMFLLSAYFHFQFNYSMKTIGKQRLEAVAQSQRNTIDLFLQERVTNIITLFHNTEFTVKPSSVQMMMLFQNLRQSSDAFIDLGFLNEKGVQIGYAGPYKNLQDREYGGEDWYNHLMMPPVNHQISDIYLGFRNKLHFTIAVKQIINDNPYVLKSTLDPDKFYLYLKTIPQGKGFESFIVNKSGVYQLVDPTFGELTGQSAHMPPTNETSGAYEARIEDADVLIAYAWLKEAHWALVTAEPLKRAYAQFYSARHVMWVSSTIIVVAATVLIWFVTRSLVDNLKRAELEREETHHQFLHASKLASVGELATGVAHEINNPLAIIMATTEVLGDMFNPEFDLDHSPEAVRAELRVIKDAVGRAKSITSQLLSFGRKQTPQLVLMKIDQIIDDILGGLKAREHSLSQITIVKELEPNLPPIKIDPDKVRQVFLNLINNAGDAIQGPGKITVATKLTDDHVVVSVTDTGVGMDVEHIRKIFKPFFTTKEVGKGTGLGLSVSMSIVEAMGGTIEVQSMPGFGSTFTVSFPRAQYQGEDYDDPVKSER
jgi:two-component system NtrC family sensor kinase